MAFWVYIPKCSDGRFYTGHTDKLDPKIAQHQHEQGGVFTTRRQPITLTWSETFGIREKALATERQINPRSRAKKQALIDGDFAHLSCAKLPAERPPTSFWTNGKNEAFSHLTSPFVSSKVGTHKREGR
jgi:putative endonuclease